MNLRSIDLNLLVIFEALVEERSVSNAAARISLSQSAVSHALRRLRVTFDDELLVRGAKGMEPTPHALQLAAAFKKSLHEIESTIAAKRGFDPATSEANLTLSISDYARPFLLPRLVSHLRLHAPNISLVVEAPHTERASNSVLYEGLQIRIAGEKENGPTRTLHLIDDRFSVLFGDRHPDASAKLSLERYLQLDHIKVTGVGSSAIDDMLARDGHARRIVCKVPTWLDALPLVKETNLVVAMPSHWDVTELMASCVVKPLPLDLSLSLEAAWHPRNDEDSAHRWVRETIQTFFSEVRKQISGVALD